MKSHSVWQIPWILLLLLRCSCSEENETIQHFSVTQVWFQRDCLQSGCWNVLLSHETSEDESEKRIFFLPRSSNPGLYEASDPKMEKEANSFPCRPKFGKRSLRGLCCLDTLGQKFWMTSEIASGTDNAENIDCTASKIRSERERYSSPNDKGRIIGLDVSRLRYPKPDRLAFQLDSKELKMNAALSHQEHGGEHSLETYIGMATFHTRDPFTYAGIVKKSFSLSQTGILPVQRGTSLRTSYVDFVSVVLNQIDLNSGASKLDYIQVLVVLSSSYMSNGDIIPLNSIFVGKGKNISTVNLTSACSSQANNSIWDDQNLRDKFSNLDSTCAPILNLCQLKLHQSGGNFISIGIPLGENFFTSDDIAKLQDIFMEFTVTAQDLSGNTVSTDLQVMIPLIENGYVSWCSEAKADIVIGSTDQIDNLQNGKLIVLENILFQANQSSSRELVVTNFSAASPESALVTLVLQGQDSFFNLQGAANNVLELVDVISLHFPDSSVIYEEIMSLLMSGQALTIDKSGLHPTMTPTSALLDLCNTVANSGCFLRYDMQDMNVIKQSPGISGGCVDTTIMELNGTAQSMEQNSFFQTVFGTSEYSRNLGIQYATIVQGKYLLNGRYNRAWWFNPANCYNQTVTWYPSKVAMISLISLYSPTTSQRRVAFDVQLSTGKNSFGLALPVNPAEQAARALGFLKNGAIVYNFRLGLSLEESSMELVKLKQSFQSRLSVGLSELGAVQEVRILAFHRSGSMTSSQSSASAPTVTAAFFKALIIFVGQEATFNESTLVAILPDVHLISCSVSTGISRTLDPRLDPPANTSDASSYANGSATGGTWSTVSSRVPTSVYGYIILSCGVVGVACISAFSIRRYRARAQQDAKLDEGPKVSAVAELVYIVNMKDVEELADVERGHA
ncbi:hypothetical protein GUITHDRAFT_166411 [Guillardia theta CCMP2712]|uniref:Uncharacterized protein n=1 Tax=Guillardia theta (strain CCMP2712) TaxID=905079 RepID=L1ICG4_GUITC|nr:hypothetical protein GUITHDRAFT_166411 [Guillardia theta CCMP2712]EKX33619.1 hypothetical protein GUITHDRAFT_166411 [Guillardia theta CCMP2712]|eukprot:XP_005820599.1 hypothetical protein GUITHDRAFT_166411 [Guillardia theta CCMP2712]